MHIYILLDDAPLYLTYYHRSFNLPRPTVYMEINYGRSLIPPQHPTPDCSLASTGGTGADSSPEDEIKLFVRSGHSEFVKCVYPFSQRQEADPGRHARSGQERSAPYIIFERDKGRCRREMDSQHLFQDCTLAYRHGVYSAYSSTNT
jgi:hypothetical protein